MSTKGSLACFDVYGATGEDGQGQSYSVHVYMECHDGDRDAIWVEITEDAANPHGPRQTIRIPDRVRPLLLAVLAKT